MIIIARTTAGEIDEKEPQALSDLELCPVSFEDDERFVVKRIIGGKVFEKWFPYWKSIKKIHIVNSENGIILAFEYSGGLVIAFGDFSKEKCNVTDLALPGFYLDRLFRLNGNIDEVLQKVGELADVYSVSRSKTDVLSLLREYEGREEFYETN